MRVHAHVCVCTSVCVPGSCSTHAFCSPQDKNPDSRSRIWGFWLHQASREASKTPCTEAALLPGSSLILPQKRGLSAGEGGPQVPGPLSGLTAWPGPQADSVSPLRTPLGPYAPPPARPETSSYPPSTTPTPPRLWTVLFPLPHLCPFPLSHRPVKRKGRSQGWGTAWLCAGTVLGAEGTDRAPSCPHSPGAEASAALGSAMGGGPLGVGAGAALASLLPGCFLRDKVIASVLGQSKTWTSLSVSSKGFCTALLTRTSCCRPTCSAVVCFQAPVGQGGMGGGGSSWGAWRGGKEKGSWLHPPIPTPILVLTLAPVSPLRPQALDKLCLPS